MAKVNTSARVLAQAAKATSIAGCVSLVLHGGPVAAAEPALEEIVVTANRRDETVSKAPYNISAYNSDQLKSANVTSVTALSQQVPNFVIQDSGARNSASQVPIMRGLNASQPSGSLDQPRYFQSPVGSTWAMPRSSVRCPSWMSSASKCCVARRARSTAPARSLARCASCLSPRSLANTAAWPVPVVRSSPTRRSSTTTSPAR